MGDDSVPSVLLCKTYNGAKEKSRALLLVREKSLKTKFKKKQVLPPIPFGGTDLKMNAKVTLYSVKRLPKQNVTSFLKS